MLESDIIRSAGFWEGSSCYGAGSSYPVEGGAVLFRTSGSTGDGRWVVLGKDALLRSARAVNEWLHVGRDSIWGLALPVDHVGGFGVVARSFAADCGFAAYARRWDAVRFSEWIGQAGVTHVSLVPTQIYDLLSANMTGYRSLRAVVVGGGRLDVEAGQAARDAGWPVLASYGMTETCSQVATQRIDSVMSPFVDCPLELLPIWDADTTQNGLLRLKGDALFSGTVEGGKFRRREGEWFTTSDRTEVSGRTIQPLGRTDTMVKVMGELVNVEAVEIRLAACCGVREVAVVPVQDKRNEHALLAVFEGKADEAAVVRYNRSAPGPERMSGWRLVKEFPRSDLGKLRRADLANMIQR